MPYNMDFISSCCTSFYNTVSSLPESYYPGSTSCLMPYENPRPGYRRMGLFHQGLRPMWLSTRCTRRQLMDRSVHKLHSWSLGMT